MKSYLYVCKLIRDQLLAAHINNQLIFNFVTHKTVSHYHFYRAVNFYFFGVVREKNLLKIYVFCDTTLMNLVIISNIMINCIIHTNHYSLRKSVFYSKLHVY